MQRVLVALGLFATLIGLGLQVHADPAAAEALFQEGRALLEQGKLEQACEKFASSHANEPSSGTLLNLADCRERQGKTATAWAHFVAAERLARVQNRPEHETEAARRIRILEPELSSLSLQIATAPSGLEIRVNGRPVDPTSVGTSVPTDPGPVVIDASAPGYRPAHIETTLEPSRRITVEIPPLAPETSPTPPPLSTEVSHRSVPPPVQPRETHASPTDSNDSNALPWVVTGVGAAMVATGAVFGVLALSANADAENACAGRTTECPEEALEKESERDRYAVLSTIGIGVGLAGVGLGTFLILDSSSDSKARGPSALAVSATFGPSRAGVRAALSF